ncbi:MAG: hypothetical protein KatS3mg110_3471 [Pirellulaceae bacterium]|nr:MAG: hypothetical protein KatS3mg110_3471 [Pirellulaceae bacterium]
MARDIGIGPVDPVEWVALSRWLGATWRIWRLMKPSADVEEEQIHRPGRHWKITDELLQVKPLDENLRDRVRRNLAHWLQVWGQACQLSGLSTQEEVQQWVERLLAARENPDELAGVVALLMGYWRGGVGEVARGARAGAVAGSGCDTDGRGVGAQSAEDRQGVVRV